MVRFFSLKPPDLEGIWKILTLQKVVPNFDHDDPFLGPLFVKVVQVAPLKTKSIFGGKKSIQFYPLQKDGHSTPLRVVLVPQVV